METGLKNEIKMLNVKYLTLARKIGDESNNGYAQTILGLEENVIKTMTGLNFEEMEWVADVGVPLLRLKFQDFEGTRNHYRQGDPERVASLLAAGLVADCGREGS